MLHIEVMNLIAQQNQIQNRLKELLPSLKDTSIPLDERWAAFQMLVSNKVFNQVELYGDGFIETLGPNLTLFDDFYYNRGETILYTRMYEHIVEADGEYQKKLVEAKVNLDAWREAVLASGYSGFVYDW